MAKDIFNNKNVSIPPEIAKNVGNEFTSKGVEYIITCVKSYSYIEVYPKNEWIKRVTCKKCNDGIIRTLKEIEE